MSAAERWCVGFDPQPPHIPTQGGLVAILDGRGARLCTDCHRRWQAADTHPSEGGGPDAA